jgi:hypothetical protein
MTGKAVPRLFFPVLLVSILALSLSAGALEAQASAETILFVDPAVATVNVGESFAVNVCIEDVVDLFSYETKLGFDKAVLTAVAVEEGPFIRDHTTSPMGTFFLQNIEADFVHVGCLTMGKYPGVNGSGILFIVTFNATRSGTSSLHLYGSILLDSNVTQLSHSTVDGAVSVTLLGDVNGDGVVNVLDLAIVSLAYGSFEGEPNYNPDADINADGVVDMRDLFIVARHLGEAAS